MKKNIRSGAIAVFTVLLSGTAIAQMSDAVKETQALSGPVVKEKTMERPPLKRGELGVRYMPTFSSLEVRTSNLQTIQGDITANQGFGIMLAGNISKNVGIQAEMNYLEINQKYRDQNLDRHIKVSYVNIPVMLSLNTDKTRKVNFNMVTGPQFGINVGSSLKTTGDENSETLHGVVEAKGTDIGLAYGAGLEFALNKKHTLRLDPGFRGFYGLSEVSSKQTSNSPNTYNVIVRASRQTYAGYLGLTWCF